MRQSERQPSLRISRQTILVSVINGLTMKDDGNSLGGLSKFPNLYMTGFRVQMGSWNRS
jgi:hypothetical protein